MNKKIISTFGLLIAVGALTGCEQVQQQAQNTVQPQVDVNTIQTQQAEYVVDESDNIKPRTLLDTTPVGELTSAEEAGLIQMREEEKLAHDVYVTMYEKWGQNIFNNISKSEQTHTDTVKYILDKYEIKDPTTDTTVGVFTSPDMQKLYDDLVTQGNKSLVDALIVGATIEDLDISDLDKLLAQTTNEDIKIAYQNLNKGSRNHMRAFVRNLERNGGTYEVQYISQQRYQEIVDGAQERGNVDGLGKGSGGNGQGGRSQGEGRGRGQGSGGRGMNRVQ